MPVNFPHACIAETLVGAVDAGMTEEQLSAHLHGGGGAEPQRGGWEGAVSVEATTEVSVLRSIYTLLLSIGLLCCSCNVQS